MVFISVSVLSHKDLCFCCAETQELSPILKARHWLVFVPDCLFMSICVAKIKCLHSQQMAGLLSLRRYNIVFQSKGQTCLLSSIIKIMYPVRAKAVHASWSLEIWVSYTQDSTVMSSFRCVSIFISPMGIGTQGTQAAILASAIAMNNKLSFIFDPWVSFLVLASLKLWQANLLVCK